MSTAPGWERWSEAYARSMTPLFERLLDAARVGPGARVLDIACGAGQPAIPAALRVGPSGSVVAIDADPEMVLATQRLARAAGTQGLDVLQMDMHALALPDATFDAVTFGFALMFSPDPPQVMREILRVLRPGGRVAVSVWGEPADNPFFTTMFGAIAAHAPAPAPAPGAPGPFRLAPAGALARVLAEAGFVTVEVEPIAVTMVFDSLDHHWEMNRDMAVPLKNLADRLAPDELARLRRSLAEALAPYVAPDGAVRVPATPLLAIGTRPG